MKKYKKSTHIHRLRRLLHEVIYLRDRGKCRRCGRDHGKLDCSHIMPKGHYPSMQFIQENNLLLCYQCHRWWHENPVYADFWLKNVIGNQLYKTLKTLTLKTETVNRSFLEQEEIRLKEYRAELLAQGSSDG